MTNALRAVAGPLLFAAFPVLFLYGQNADEVSAGEVIGPVLASVATAALLLALLWRPVGPARATVGVSIGMLLASSYGHVFPHVDQHRVGDTIVDGDRLLLPIWGLLTVVVIVLLRRLPRTSDRAIRSTAAIGVVLAITALLPAVGSSGASAPRPIAPTTAASAGGEQTHRPDIYYLVFDRYPGEHATSNALGVDNSDFIEGLRAQGFSVARDARSNYPDTPHSLASSLNMTYMQDLFEPGAPSADWKPIHDLLADNLVARDLQARGYRYVHIGSWWEPTRTSPIADVVRTVDAGSEFSQVLYDTSILRPIASALGIGEDRWDVRRLHWRRVHEQLAEIRNADLPGPTFVFAHLLLPHYPFAFDLDGSFVSRSEEVRHSWVGNMVRQLSFTNEAIEELVDDLLDRPADDLPVVILQADEGPHPPRFEASNDVPWSSATDDELMIKFPILNAVHVPGGGYELPPSASPVNQFRRLFRHLFGADLPDLPDRQFVFPTWRDVYRFEDVTDRVR